MGAFTLRRTAFSEGDLCRGGRRHADVSGNTEGRARHVPGSGVPSAPTRLAFTAAPGEKGSWAPRSAHTQGRNPRRLHTQLVREELASEPHRLFSAVTSGGASTDAGSRDLLVQESALYFERGP